MTMLRQSRLPPIALLLLALALAAADLAPVFQRVVGSSRSNIDHAESCRHARRIGSRNYRACRVCRPG